MKISTTVIALVLASSFVGCSKAPKKPSFQPAPQAEAVPTDTIQALGSEGAIVSPVAAEETKTAESDLSPESPVNPVEITEASSEEKEEAPAESPRSEEEEVADACELSVEGSELVIDFIDANGATQSAVQAFEDDNCQIPAEETAQQS